MQNNKESDIDLNSWIDKIKSWNQNHLIENYDSVKDTSNIVRLVKQIKHLNDSYPGGLANYIERSRNLLNLSKLNYNPFSDFVPTLPDRAVLPTECTSFAEAERIGLANVGSLAFVLVAGGLGERLGYTDVKINLPIETCTGMTYLEYYVRLVIACEGLAEKATGKRPKLPLSILTSDDTHKRTSEILRINKNYGLEDDQVTLMKQNAVPAMMDDQARFATLHDDPFTIETKPHGHGDVHQLLYLFDLPSKWISKGLKWLIIFQDTNGLFSHAVCPMLGVSIQNQYAMNSLAVSRRKGEPVGAICKLERRIKHGDGKINTNGSSNKDESSFDLITINVEYNQLSSLLATNEESKDLDFPGNANVLLFNLKRYNEVLQESTGNIPEFVNPKYADDSRTKFKSSARLESLMQEFPRLLKAGDKVNK